MTKTFHQPGLKCPTCGKDADGMSARLEGEKPTTGDVVLCLYCASVNVFGFGLQLRKAKVSDIAKLEPDEIQELARVRQRVLAVANPWRKA